jgi:hypothetical protein
MAEVDRRLGDPLAAGRANQGGIGFVGPDIPIEVLIASGRPFGHLPWHADDATPWANQWLESSFPYWSRSILEQWQAGSFDSLETVVFSRADDASQRLYYYVRELQRRGKLRGPAARIFDIALIDRQSSLAHTESAVTELMSVLDVAADALPGAIEQANGLRRRFSDIERDRVANGPLYERFARAALWTNPCQWIGALQLPKSPPAETRILLAGSMPPDGRLHEAVESTGASVVAEAHALALDRLGVVPGTVPHGNGTGIETDEQPARALARKLRVSSISPRAFFDRGQWIVKRARSVHADAVVIWLTREDEALAWTAPSQQRALVAAGLPVLLLAARRWQADDGACEQIAEFAARCARASA